MSRRRDYSNDLSIEEKVAILSVTPRGFDNHGRIVLA